MKSLAFAIALALAVAGVGCAQPTLLKESIDLDPVVGSRDLRGLSVDGENLDVLVAGQGIVTVTRAGALVSERKPGERGLWSDIEYKDLASIGDEQFVLLADVEGYLYDARTESQRVHFCVEPGFEPEPSEPVLTQVNDAVAASGNIIVAAPRFYSDGALVSTELRTYLAGDGTPIDNVDLMELGVELRGLALHGDEILGVQGNELHTFSIDGDYKSTAILDGLDEAGGVAVRDGELIVADEDAAALRVYDVAALEQGR